MNKYPFLKDLNKQQLKAAKTTEGPVLILAGAGSGKTKTIIARTAYLLASKKASAENILIMTFTNKAAREMKERGQKMLEDNKNWNGIMPDFTTFHSWGMRFIKSLSIAQLATVGLMSKFTIADTSDQVAILNKIKILVFPEEIAKAFKPDKFLLTLGVIQNSNTKFDSRESSHKTISELIKKKELDLSMFNEITPGIILAISNLFFLYKKELRLNNTIDFDDLINIPSTILEGDKILKSSIKLKYQYLMIDEFQDTNTSQLRLLNNILNVNNNICVVGDDSQSIYGWRGANISYILNFHKRFENCTNINLSINYRSSKEIVKKANKILGNASERHEKKVDLVAHKDQKGIVQGKFHKDLKEEALSISNTISALITKKNVKPGNIAILYRTAFIINELELELINKGVPYKIHKGKTLLERKAAKAVISYLKIIQNVNNNIALMNLLSSSKILSDKRVSEFSADADIKEITLINYLSSGEYKKFPRIAKGTIDKIDSFIFELREFIALNEENYSIFYSSFSRSNTVRNIYQKVLDDSITQDIPEAKLHEANSNINILNMVNALGLKYNSLETLLETIAIEGEEEDCEENKVNLMTIHASKGLEFEVVFLMGAANGIFPGPKCTTFKQMEEERRLFYVAITRAKHMLRVSGAAYYFRTQDNKKLTHSRFIKEAKIEIT